MTIKRKKSITDWRKSQNEIHNRMKSIRGFVDFNYDLRHKLAPAQVAKINRYYDAIKELAGGSVEVHRPRRKDNLSALQEYSHGQHNLKGIKVAFVPKTGKGLEIAYSGKGKNRRVKIKTEHAITDFIPINPRKLVQGDTSYIDSLVKDSTNTQLHTVMVGDNKFIAQPFYKGEISNAIAKLQMKYSETGDDGAKKNNHIDNWLRGIQRTTHINQNSVEAFMLEREKLQGERNRRKKEYSKQRYYLNKKKRSS